MTLQAFNEISLANETTKDHDADSEGCVWLLSEAIDVHSPHRLLEFLVANRSHLDRGMNQTFACGWRYGRGEVEAQNGRLRFLVVKFGRKVIQVLI